MSEATEPATDALAHRLPLSAGQSIVYYTLNGRSADDSRSAEPAATRPTIILLHGMRDTGRSLLPIAAALNADFDCVLPDLRGHGQSLRPGSYAIQHYLMDLRRLIAHLKLERVALLGHSLGGHIVSRYAGMFTSAISALMIVEGLGPPLGARSAEGDIAGLSALLDSAIQTAARAEDPRVMPDRAAAAERLLANNPGLSESFAAQLATWGTEAVDGGVVWAFDPRAQEVFLGVSHRRNLDYWRSITAPTAILLGADSHHYWARRAANGDGRFAPGELDERLQCFRDVEYHEIAAAGHQVHYDQPDAFAALAQDFFRRKLG
ncbi:MAG: alpha/beta hydrolase [Pseudomonadota bacterium]